MGFYYAERFGTFHLNEGKPARVVPGHERHKWSSRPAWGEQTTCLKCGCVKRRRKPEYSETYQVPGHQETTERPACQPPKTE